MCHARQGESSSLRAMDLAEYEALKSRLVASTVALALSGSVVVSALSTPCSQQHVDHSVTLPLHTFDTHTLAVLCHRWVPPRGPTHRWPLPWVGLSAASIR